MTASLFAEAVRSARASNVPLLGFNFVDLASAEGILDAAARSRRPVILQASARTVEFYGARTLRGALSAVAANRAVPAFLHLDHCSRDDLLAEALEAGFDGVMADGSHLPRDENVRWTTDWARRAHERGAVAEGEVTAIRGTGTEEGQSGGYARTTTSHSAFREFAQATGVDLLGADVGTAHGLYVEEPVIDYAFVARVRDAAAGFVVHGGSGLPSRALGRLAAAGVAKINFSTEVKLAWAGPMARLEADREPEPVGALRRAREAVAALAETKWAAVGGGG